MFGDGAGSETDRSGGPNSGGLRRGTGMVVGLRGGTVARTFAMVPAFCTTSLLTGFAELRIEEVGPFWANTGPQPIARIRTPTGPRS
jgi:hypothetical protein